mgnify:CR=1 FL=1
MSLDDLSSSNLSFEECLQKIKGKEEQGVSECLYLHKRMHRQASNLGQVSYLHEKDAFMTCGEGGQSSNCNRQNIVDRFFNLSSKLLSQVTRTSPSHVLDSSQNSSNPSQNVFDK